MRLQLDAQSRIHETEPDVHSLEQEWMLLYQPNYSKLFLYYKYTAFEIYLT